MIVEQLRFEVPPSALEAFLERDHRVWTAFLGGCHGFVDKQVWIAESDGAVVMNIWWSSRDAWKSIDTATLTRVESEMGDLSCAPTCSEHRVWMASPNR